LRHPTPTLFPYTTLFRSQWNRFLEQLRSHQTARRTEDGHDSTAFDCFGKGRRGRGRAGGGGRLAEVRQESLIEGAHALRLSRQADRKSTRLNSSHSQISY